MVSGMKNMRYPLSVQDLRENVLGVLWKNEC